MTVHFLFCFVFTGNLVLHVDVKTAVWESCRYVFTSYCRLPMPFIFRL